MRLSGRYQLKPSILGGVRLFVEEYNGIGYIWRRARPDDLAKLEPAVADGWRFPEERHGILCADGKRV